MSIQIHEARCKGCRSCLEICPGNLISLSPEGRARLEHPEECWGCAACLKECRHGAISYFLGADIGGQGGRMYTQEEGPLRRWIILRPGGERLELTVDPRDANQY